MIVAFSALRFFNALMIFCHHKNSIDNPYLVAFGPCAVSFFLMLSGFVMCYGYKEKVLAPDFSYKKFLFKRFARLYPLHLLCLFLWLGLNIKSVVSCGEGQILSIICNLFLVQSWIPKQTVYFSGNAVSWCLSDLFFFYAVFPFVIRLLQKKNRVISFSVIYFVLYGILLPLIPKDYVHAFVYINPLFRFSDFYIGVLLYKLYTTTKDKLENKNMLGIVFQVLSVLITGIAIFVYKYVPECLHFQALFFIPSAMLVLSFALFDKNVFSKLLSVKLFNYLGEISFTFYMLHTLGIAFVGLVISHLGLEINFIYKSFLQFAFVLIGSAVVHKFYEKPAANKFLMVFDRKYDS
ncbi:MAG: acyltransferase [Bacteroidales bacterium]|nr:acyltransferase [Bacteroidales bacterium]